MGLSEAAASTIGCTLADLSNAFDARLEGVPIYNPACSSEEQILHVLLADDCESPTPAWPVSALL